MHRIHYLVWRRGFAPILFILAVALTVVAVGSGFYFTTHNDTGNTVSTTTAETVSPRDIAIALVPEVVNASTTIADSTSLIVKAPPTVEIKPITQKAVIYYDCGSSEKAAECIKNRSRTCAPAKAIVTDGENGVKGELVIDGYQGNACSYRMNMLSGGATPVLAGLSMHCMIPRSMFDGKMTIMDDSIFAFCTGTLIDFMREQGNPS